MVISFWSRQLEFFQRGATNGKLLANTGEFWETESLMGHGIEGYFLPNSGRNVCTLSVAQFWAEELSYR